MVSQAAGNGKTNRAEFVQVEEILGGPLPASATKLKTWWTNIQPKIQSHRTAWLNNGWLVAECDQKGRWVRFVCA